MVRGVVNEKSSIYTVNPRGVLSISIYTLFGYIFRRTDLDIPFESTAVIITNKKLLLAAKYSSGAGAGNKSKSFPARYQGMGVHEMHGVVVPPKRFVYLV